jgi:hypothetical protein
MWRRRLMYGLVLVLILLASPAFGAGDATEELCDYFEDNPGEGVSCRCSEMLTKDDGTKTAAFNPSGSPDTGEDLECLDGWNPIGNLGSAEMTWVSAASTGLDLDKDGQKNIAHAQGGWNIEDTNTTFTDGTYCGRYYVKYSSSYECNGSCNFKGPRYESAGGVKYTNTPGVETFTNRPAEDPDWKMASYTCALQGACRPNSTETGCTGPTHLRQQDPQNLTFEQTQTGWMRWEVCFDHNLSSDQVIGSGGINDTYGTALTYPGLDYTYVRMRRTMVTGAYAGKEVLSGPAYLTGYTPVCDDRAWSPVAEPKTGSRTRIVAIGIQGYNQDDPPTIIGTNGTAHLGFVMSVVKTAADPTFWIGAAYEVTADNGGPTPTPTASPTSTATPTATPTGPTPTATATPTATPTATSTATPTATPTTNPINSYGQEFQCPGETYANAAWLFCDNFNAGDPVTDKWNQYSGDNFFPQNGTGFNSSIGMLAYWSNGEKSAGHFSIALGPLPDYYDEEYFPHVINPGTTYTALYTRQYVRFAPEFFGDDDSEKKFFRYRILSDPKDAAEQNAMCTGLDEPFGCCTGDVEDQCLGDGDHPTAYQGHLWNQKNTYPGALFYNSTNGVDAEGQVISTGNNCGGDGLGDCPEMVWMPRVRGTIELFVDWPEGSDWFCVESHIILNTPGSSDGTEEFWIDSEGGDDGLEGRLTDQNMRGTYNDYGINQVVFDNYWNDGSSAEGNVLHRDNIVIATERIGCDVTYYTGPTGVLN